MSEENRMDRLESKVDDIKEDVSELKADLKIHTVTIDKQLELFGEHVTSDTRIVKHIQPLLDDLPSIKAAVDEFKFERKLKAKNKERVKTVSSVLGVLSLVVGIVYTLTKI